MLRYLAATAALASLAAATGAQDRPRVLFLSKSSGFEHPAIKQTDGQPSHVDRVLQSVAARHDFDLTASKDASLISASSLADFDAVVFYTTGDLTQPGKGEGLFGGDGQTAMAEHGLADLRDWVGAGGALLGFHSASDTFHGADDDVSPYIDLLGGEFSGHGRQFEGRLRVVDEGHPAIAGIPQGWTVMDEWYTFKNLGHESMHVLALLETASDTLEQSIYEVADYPVIWCRSFGEGRVFYNAMGHREDVWDREIFQEAFAAALHWALGGAEAGAEPNYSAVVPGGE